MPFQTLSLQCFVCVNKDSIIIRFVLNCFRSYFSRAKHTQIGHVYITTDYFQLVYFPQKRKHTQIHTHYTHIHTHIYSHTNTHTNNNNNNNNNILFIVKNPKKFY